MLRNNNNNNNRGCCLLFRVYEKEKREFPSVSSRSHGKVRLTSRTSRVPLWTRASANIKFSVLSVGKCTHVSFAQLFLFHTPSRKENQRKRGRDFIRIYAHNDFDKNQTIIKKGRRKKTHLQKRRRKNFVADGQRRWIEASTRPTRGRARWLDPLGPSQHHRWWTSPSVFGLE